MDAALLPEETCVGTKTCALSGKAFFITDKDLIFYDQMSPVFGGQKYLIPVPTLSPKTRMQRRMTFRNERYLYEGKCCFSGKSLVSMYHPDAKRKVCETKLWWGDSWSGFDYGRRVDFDRPIFPQIAEIWDDVPMMALYFTGNSENCDYTNHFGGGKSASKNCYLCFNSGDDEDCMFCKGVINSKDCLEMFFGAKDDHCYECINCNECYGVFFSQDCTNSRECTFCNACVGCQNCFGCINLVGQQYYIFNEKVEKSVYEKRMKELRITQKNFPLIAAQVQKFHNTHPVRCHHNVKCENAIGDYLVNCKNVIGFEVFDCENVKYVNSSKHAKDSMDMTGYGYFSDHMLESLGSGHGSRVGFTACCDICSDVYYSAWCMSSNHLFGCVGIKHGAHTVFNTAMSQQEYDILVPKVIEHMKSTGEWGEFFHPSISPFGYNETIGNDNFPLDRKTVENYGWQWYDIPKKERNGAYLEPLDVSQYDPAIMGAETAEKNSITLTNGIVQCEETGEPFRILKEELRFYILHDLPIPRKHPQVRYNKRIERMNPRELNTSSCSECGVKIQTTYLPGDRKILCEECYRKRVY